LFFFLFPFDAIASRYQAGDSRRPFVQSALYTRACAVHKVVKVQEFTGAARRADDVTFRLKTARLVKQLDVGVYLARFIELAVYIARPFLSFSANR